MLSKNQKDKEEIALEQLGSAQASLTSMEGLSDERKEFVEDEKVTEEEKESAEKWIDTIDIKGVFSSFKEIDRIRAFRVYNSIQQERGWSCFYRGVSLEASQEETREYVLENIQKSIVEELTALLINLLGKESAQRNEFLEKYSDENIMPATDLVSFLSLITKKMIRLFVEKDKKCLTDLLWELDFLHVLDACMKRIDTFVSESMLEIISFEKAQALLAVALYEPFFMYQFEESKKKGCVYSPPGGPKNHNLLINFCWLLSNIHKQNSFVILSELEISSSHRIKNGDAEKSEGPILCSAFAIEIISAMEAGYAIKKIGEKLRLVSPGTPELLKFKIHDFLSYKLISHATDKTLNDKMRETFEKLVVFIKQIKINEESEPVLLEAVLKNSSSERPEKKIRQEEDTVENNEVSGSPSILSAFAQASQKRDSSVVPENPGMPIVISRVESEGSKQKPPPPS